MKNKKYKDSLNSLTFYFSLTVFLILAATVTVLLTLFYLFNQFSNVRPSLFIIIITLALASLSIGTFFSFYFSRIALQPFRQMIEAMDKVANGDFNVQLDFSSPAELKQFSNSFNLMTKELQNTEILRSDFINSFSHEFKTPIISIKGFTALLKKGNLTKEEQDEYLDIIIEETTRLTELSTNVLNLTKLENTEILTGTVPCNLAEQIRHCLVLLESRWEKKKLQMELALKDLKIIGSPDLLQQIWLNLIDNAIKFSSENDTLHIMMIETEQFVSVIIKDEGVGMHADQIQQVFRKFYQTDAGKKQGGNGLGLSVVKRIVELHKGIISIESKPDQGTSITVSLPKEKISV